jgi:hypothetical protein
MLGIYILHSLSVHILVQTTTEAECAWVTRIRWVEEPQFAAQGRYGALTLVEKYWDTLVGLMTLTSSFSSENVMVDIRWPFVPAKAFDPLPTSTRFCTLISLSLTLGPDNYM